MALRHRDIVKKRTIWLFMIFALLFLGLAARLAYVQVVRNETYKEWAKRIRYRDILLPASRGSIYDRHGRPLAVSLEATAIFASRDEVAGHKDQTAASLAEALNLPERSIREKLDGRDSIIWLARHLDPRTAAKVLDSVSDLAGIGTERDPRRVYPAGSLAAHVLGFTSAKNSDRAGLVTEGVEGLECALDEELRGSEGKVRTELDARRRPIAETRHVAREPQDGDNVYLTLDLGIQHIAEVALARTVERYHPEQASAIVMDPRTGEILSLCNWPTFDPNRPRRAASAAWRDSAVSDLFEPGSTLKVITVAAALNEGISPRQAIACCTGHERTKGGRLTCSLHRPFLSGHGSVDMYKIIRYSCNIGAAHLGFRLGAEKLTAYHKAFGLLDQPRTGLPGEARNFSIPPKDWCRIRVGNVGFGQGIAMTPLQMACAYATIANGGVYVQPQIVREIRRADGSVERPFKPRPLRRVISREAAAQLTEMMAGCVEGGTGKTAQIAGRTVAGKTGSAQIGMPRGGFESGAFIASFMGFVPATNPRLVIAVVVTRPKGCHWGATVAAPVFQEIGEKALWYLKVPADAPVKQEPKRDKEAGLV